MTEEITASFAELLTIQEVASLLRVDEATVRRWIKQGILAAITLPHAGKRELHRIKRTTLEQVLTPTGATAPE
jgi:excisionase family DNA binding protein